MGSIKTTLFKNKNIIIIVLLAAVLGVLFYSSSDNRMERKYGDVYDCLRKEIYGHLKIIDPLSEIYDDIDKLIEQMVEKTMPECEAHMDQLTGFMLDEPDWKNKATQEQIKKQKENMVRGFAEEFKVQYAREYSPTP